MANSIMIRKVFSSDSEGEYNPNASYAKMVSRSIATIIFVMGEYFRNSGNRVQTLKAYQRAAALGYTMAQVRINQMIIR